MNLSVMTRGLVLFCIMTVSAKAGFLNPTTFKLDNGLKVVVIEDHRSPTVDVYVAIGVGSADEVSGKSGVAHFLEHMMFKGVPGESESGFNEKINSHGGEANAFTSYDSTVYIETMPKEHLEVALDLEARRLRALTITDDQVERERKVILEELSFRIDGNHNQMAYQAMMSKLLTQHPYRRSIGGYIHEVKSLSSQDILDFHKTWYSPGNVTLVLSGDITPDEARRVAAKHLSSLPPRNVPSRIRLSEPPSTDNTQVHLAFQDKRIKQPQLCYQHVLPPVSDDKAKELEAMSMLPKLLSAPNKGALWKDLVERQKIATDISLTIDSRKDLTLVELSVAPSANVSLANLENAVGAAVKEVMDHLDRVVTEEAVKQIIRQETWGQIYAKDSLQMLAHIYAMQLASGFSLERLEASLEVLQSVKAQDVRTAAQQVFGKRFLLTTYILPQEEKQ